MAGNFIHSQFEAASHEAWKELHDEAMDRYELEDTLTAGVQAFNYFRTADEHWTKGVESGDLPFSEDVVASFQQAYEWWLKPAPGMLKVVEYFENQYGEMKGAKELRECVQVARQLVSISDRQIIDLVKEAEQQSIPCDLNEVIRNAVKL